MCGPRYLHALSAFRTLGETAKVRRIYVLAAMIWGLTATSQLAAEIAATTITQDDSRARLVWIRDRLGWRLNEVIVRSDKANLPVGVPSGEYTLLYSLEPPSDKSLPVPWSGPTGSFPEPSYGHVKSMWKDATTPAALNQAGQTFHFFPQQGVREEDGAVSFAHQTAVAQLRAVWRLDPQFPGDLKVTMTVTALQDGHFSLASPTLATVQSTNLAWAMVPGVFAGAQLQPDLVSAYGYGQGLPMMPVIARERSTSTLASLISHRSGATVAVIAEPGTATDPWAESRDTRQEWRLGLSHMNRRGELAATLYHPVLGQVDSKMAQGETRTFQFRYSLRAAGWYEMLHHIAYDTYGLRDFLDHKHPSRPLSDRLRAMRGYVTDTATSKWRTEEFNGETIGAQAYLGGVVGSDGDAMKNSDYGAMWMLAHLTSDAVLTQDRFPYARAFKLAQQQAETGFFQGAAVGQYYLSKSKRFAEEWGAYVEPVALTYYVLCDMGNMLLFEPNDKEIRRRLRLGADRLLSWQHADGHWEVAYGRATTEPLFTDLSDLRPTFYGLLVAYRCLGDDKYLSGARRGADWLIEHAVEPRRFVGVCGDVRFAPDFATAQIAQALIDLHDVTGDRRYHEAGVAAARFYATSVFTHPTATAEQKFVNGMPCADWEISQVGLSFEHGGTLGSANNHGPILLASHAGLFIRVHQITGDPLLRDLARAGVLARDAFVDPATSVASYYWKWMNRGPGAFPHHAWWQIGWITDYLVSEASLRSAGQINFPRGFFTPKVGPHAAYGFASGSVFGQEAALAWRELEIEHEAIDVLLAVAPNGGRKFIILLNSSARVVTTEVRSDSVDVIKGDGQEWSNVDLLSADGIRMDLDASGPTWRVELPAFDLAVLVLDE